MLRDTLPGDNRTPAEQRAAKVQRRLATSIRHHLQLDGHNVTEGQALNVAAQLVDSLPALCELLARTD